MSDLTIEELKKIRDDAYAAAYTAYDAAYTAYDAYIAANAAYAATSAAYTDALNKEEGV